MNIWFYSAIPAINEVYDEILHECTDAVNGTENHSQSIKRKKKKRVKKARSRKAL